MENLHITCHAAERYIERFEGNLTQRAARSRIQKAMRNAWRLRALPGGATLYASGHVQFVVCDGAVITVQRKRYAPHQDFARRQRPQGGKPRCRRWVRRLPHSPDLTLSPL